MTRSRFAVIAAAALVLAACGNDDAQSGAAPAADASSTAPAGAAAPAPVPDAAPPTGLSGAPGVAQRGVDSANAAYQRQADEVNRMSQPEAGATTP